MKTKYVYALVFGLIGVGCWSAIGWHWAQHNDAFHLAPALIGLFALLVSAAIAGFGDEIGAGLAPVAKVITPFWNKKD